MTAHTLTNPNLNDAAEIHRAHKANGCDPMWTEVYAGRREYALDIATVLNRIGIRAAIKRDGIRFTDDGRAVYLTVAETCIAELIVPMVADVTR